MTILLNVVLALAIFLAATMLSLMLNEVKTTKLALANASGADNVRAAKMEVEARNIWVGFSIVLIGVVGASAFLIN